MKLRWEGRPEGDPGERGEPGVVLPGVLGEEVPVAPFWGPCCAPLCDSLRRNSIQRSLKDYCATSGSAAAR